MAWEWARASFGIRHSLLLLQVLSSALLFYIMWNGCQKESRPKWTGFPVLGSVELLLDDQVRSSREVLVGHAQGVGASSEAVLDHDAVSTDDASTIGFL